MYGIRFYQEGHRETRDAKLNSKHAMQYILRRTLQLTPMHGIDLDFFPMDKADRSIFYTD